MVTELKPPRLGPPPRRRLLRRATGSILPTLATLGNLICGFAAVYSAARGSSTATVESQVFWFKTAGWLIFLAMVFDALDGRLARMTRSTSDLGAQLDSLADVVSFGVAPAFLMLQLMVAQLGNELFENQWIGSETGGRIIGRGVWVIGALFVCCAALRLARFNVETNEDESAHVWFKGLPAPGAAAALAALAILMQEFAHRPVLVAWGFKTVFWILPPVALAAALMMVSNVPYPHAFNHFIRGRHPFRNLVIALLMLALLLVFRQIALAIGGVGYALSGPVLLVWRRLIRKDRRTADELAADLVTEDEEADPDDSIGQDA